tara:strand:- start:333 stop:1346 length:1014 start_codon:yes stop_codon:yes gene_type:complete
MNIREIDTTAVSTIHSNKVITNKQFIKKIYEYPNKNIYIYLNGSENYQTSCIDILPKIVGTSTKYIVKYSPYTKVVEYITNTELARAQGYTIYLNPNEEFDIYIGRIIGNSIPKIFINIEIEYYIQKLNIYNPRTAVIGAYGLEGLTLENTNYIFAGITNHITNNYLSSQQISSTISKNNPPKKIYLPHHIIYDKVDILLWKFACKYGSNLSRNSNSIKQTKEKNYFNNDILYGSDYIKRTSPKIIITELPSNINNSVLGKYNENKLQILIKNIGKDYKLKYYQVNTKDYGLKQNRRSYICIFELDLPDNILRGYDNIAKKIFYYNINTKSWSYSLI